MHLRRKLVDLLDDAYAQEQTFVQNLTDAERSLVGTPERWSSKDTIAHTAAWRDRAVQVLAALRTGEPGPGFEGADQFNARMFAEGQNLTWPEVLEKSRRAYQFLREQTQATPEYVLVAPDPSELHDEPAWWFIVGNGCTHALGHLADHSIAHGRAASAIEMQEEAAELLVQLEGPKGKVYYGLARHYAAAGRPQKAIEALGKAFGLDPSLIEQAEKDPALAQVRERPGYRARAALRGTIPYETHDAEV
jgi:tetratricopeptide (TPR) repeat protein